MSCISLAWPVFASANSEGLDLEAAYQLALKRSEDLQIQEELINQADEKISQAKGAIFPTINGVGTFLKQDNSASAPTAPSTQNTVKLNLDQPLFRGFRDFAYIRQQGKNLESVEALRDQAQIQLFSDVTQSYYNLITLQEDVRILKQQMEVNEKRLNELKNFRKIGRARDSDVLALDASIAALEATTESVRVQKESAWSVFYFLSGLSDRPALVDHDEVPETLKSLNVYLDSVESRPDIKALEDAAIAFESGITVARGAHLPSADFLGNYYFDRPGVLAPVKWDVQLAVTFPIFQGGIIQSEVRQASSQFKQADLQLQKAKRQAREDIGLFYRQLMLEFTQEKKQNLASDLAVKNYQAQLKDSRLGLVTNVDVLLALSTAQDSLRLSNKIHYQIKIDYFKLLAATNESPALKR